MAFFETYHGNFTVKEAAHLARRAGFGANPDDVKNMVSRGLAGAVASLVDFKPVDEELEAEIKGLPEDDDYLKRVKSPADLEHLSGQWLYRMVRTRQPLQEQLALMLHDTLVSSYTKVIGEIGTNVGNGSVATEGVYSDCTDGTLEVDYLRRERMAREFMGSQVELFRRLGAGSYKDLVSKVSRHPAMMLYLDNYANVKGKAQENFGRELMELFTLGGGNYSEKDVRELSRVMTGEMLNRRCSDDYPYSYEMDFGEHDTGTKTLFGESFNIGEPGGDFDHALDLIFERVSGATEISAAHERVPAVALFVGWKFLKWFVSEEIPIDHPAVEEFGTIFHATSKNGHRFDVRETLRVLFSSKFFHDHAYYYNMYKHPADFMAMAMRTLGMMCDEITRISPQKMKLMGMELYNPPQVEGWHHGRAWLNSAALITRFNYADHLSRRHSMTDEWCDSLVEQEQVQSWLDNDGIIEFFRSRLIQEELRPEEQETIEQFLIKMGTGNTTVHQFRHKVRGTMHLMMALPRYQLK